MKISGKTVTFDNGMSFGICDSYQESLEKLDGVEFHQVEKLGIFFYNNYMFSKGY